MSKYYEISPGWEPLVDTFIEIANWDVVVNEGEPVTDVLPYEKSGALRLHYVGGNCATDAYATFASRLSEKICKECGRPVSEPAANGFQSTLCDEHR